jgi:hypothetical protein
MSDLNAPDFFNLFSVLSRVGQFSKPEVAMNRAEFSVEGLLRF